MKTIHYYLFLVGLYIISALLLGFHIIKDRDFEELLGYALIALNILLFIFFVFKKFRQFSKSQKIVNGLIFWLLSGCLFYGFLLVVLLTATHYG